MTEGNEVEELTNVFRELIIQQHNLKEQLTRLNESIVNTNERLNLLIDSGQDTNRNNEVLSIPADNQAIPSTEQPDLARRGSFEVGDRVVVTNKYRGLKGTKGTIVSLSNAQATVKPDNNGATFRKYKQNLRRL
jgi:hypothetical protein